MTNTTFKNGDTVGTISSRYSFLGVVTKATKNEVHVRIEDIDGLNYLTEGATRVFTLRASGHYVMKGHTVLTIHAQ